MPRDDDFNFKPGDRVVFMTFDAPEADLRELDATTGTVIGLESDGEDLVVESLYGEVTADRFAFTRAKNQDGPRTAW